MDITGNYPEAFEKVCWEDYDIEDYHKYNEGTDEFLEWLGE